MSISRLLKKRNSNYLCSDGVVTHHAGPAKQIRSRSRMTQIILGDVNSLLAVIEREAVVPAQHVNISNRECTMRLNRLFVISVALGIVEGKDRHALDIIFPNIGGYIKRMTKW